MRMTWSLCVERREKVRWGREEEEEKRRRSFCLFFAVLSFRSNEQNPVFWQDWHFHVWGHGEGFVNFLKSSCRRLLFLESFDRIRTVLVVFFANFHLIYLNVRSKSRDLFESWLSLPLLWGFVCWLLHAFHEDLQCIWRVGCCSFGGRRLGKPFNNEKKNSWNGQTGFCQDRMEKQERRTKKSERTLETTWFFKDTAARKTGRRRVCSQTYHLKCVFLLV